MKEVKLPTISVIIPVLNSVKTIEKALLSIFWQDYQNIEIIILDAGSTDGTLDVIKRYEDKIHYWHSQPDGSAYLAINMGAKKANGEIIAQLMADDWFETGTFAALADAYQKYPAADIFSCGGRFVCFDEKTQTYKTTQVYNTAKELDLSFYNVCFGIPAMSSRFLKKTLIDKIGLFEPIDKHGKHIFSADREFLLRAITHGANSVVVNHLGHTYFAHQGSATFGKNRKTQLKIFQEHMAIAEKYLAKPDLSQTQSAIIRQWYKDQSVRYFIYNIFEWNLLTVWKTAQAGIQKFKWEWPIALVMTPCRIILKKVYPKRKSVGVAC